MQVCNRTTKGPLLTLWPNEKLYVRLICPAVCWRCFVLQIARKYDWLPKRMNGKLLGKLPLPTERRARLCKICKSWGIFQKGKEQDKTKLSSVINNFYWNAEDQFPIVFFFSRKDLNKLFRLPFLSFSKITLLHLIFFHTSERTTHHIVNCFSQHELFRL